MGIYESLLENAESGIYPMHMPGHKRNEKFLKMVNPYTIDITEVDGFDDLHAPEEIILEAMEKGKNLYKSHQCFLLVNGSTCGILSAICACVPKGGRLIAARNCHKSVYNAIALTECESVFMMPETDPQNGICYGITAAQVEKALSENPDASAVVITSPTYEGVVSDIGKISKVTRKYGVPLIVDEAHGAHFGFSPMFPESAVSKGADIVIQSLHKTLPSFTQSAVLHICTEFGGKFPVQRYLSIFQSSSPSYILMAGIDRCFDILQNDGTKLFELYENRLKKFYSSMEKLKVIKILPEEYPKGFIRDMGKIVIDLSSSSLTGGEFSQLLLKKYKIQLEMASSCYAIAMTSICDTDEGFERLKEALTEIDSLLSKSENTRHFSPLPEKIETVLKISEALSASSKAVPISEADGKISGEFIYAYPPGIPIIAPGERFTHKVLSSIDELLSCGVAVKGSSGAFKGSVKAIDC